MKTWLKTLIGVAVMVPVGVTWAGEGPLSLRLGVSYRDFDEVKFSTAEFRNWNKTNTPPYGVQNITTAPGNPILAPVILDYVRWNHASEKMDNSENWAPVIGFVYDLTSGDKVRLAVVGNFQYYSMDLGGGGASGTALAPNGFSIEQYQHFVLNGAGTLTPGAILIGAAMPGTTFSARNEFNLDLYVFDLGLEASTTLKIFSFSIALGPSLTFVDADSSQRQTASWLAQGPGLPGGTYAQNANDSNTDLLWGAYAALGVTVNVSTSWSVGLEYRYDYVSDEAGTDQAEMDLSGSSGILRLAYRF